MSDTTGQAGTRSVSMRKPTSRAPRPDIARVTPPRTIDLATAAVGVLILGLVVRAVGLLGSSSTLIAYLTNTNKHAKKPIANYQNQVNGDLHTLRSGALIQSAVVAVALVLLTYALRRTRGASGTRWAMLIIIVLTSLPFYVIPVKGWPPIPQSASVVTGLAAVAVIVLLFVPQSQAYFRACRQAVNPQAAGAAPRPGLGALFAPRQPRQPRQPRGGFGAQAAAAASARTTPQAASAPSRSGGSSARPRAKVRADADSVAKGAELARSRAKASKSRRTEG